MMVHVPLVLLVYTVMDSRCVYWQESDTIRITIRGQRYNILRFIYIAIFQCIDHFLQPETGSNKTVFLMIYFHVSVWWWWHLKMWLLLYLWSRTHLFRRLCLIPAAPLHHGRPFVTVSFFFLFLSLFLFFFLLTKFVCLLFVSPCSSAGHIQAWWELVGVQGCRPGKLCSR